MSLTSLMVFILLCFSGLFFMFYCMLRNHENLVRTLQEEMTQLRASLHVIETRVVRGAGQENTSSHTPPPLAPGSTLHPITMTEEKKPKQGLELYLD